MNEPVYSCLMSPDRRTMMILLDKKQIGYVMEINGEPELEWFADINHIAHIPFSAIDIVFDNWNTMINDLDNPIFTLTPVKK